MLKPKLETEFQHDGRGPELQKVVWNKTGTILLGFEYFNPDDAYTDENLKNIKLIGLQAYSFAWEEVHGDIKFLKGSKASILEITNSKWLSSFNPRHLKKCKHFQITFYDEIYDVVCEDISAFSGKINA